MKYINHLDKQGKTFWKIRNQANWFNKYIKRKSEYVNFITLSKCQNAVHKNLNTTNQVQLTQKSKISHKF